MASPDGSQPEPIQPLNTTWPVRVQCWVLMITDGDGPPTPVWAPFQVTLGSDGEAVLS